jgi:hypothetical protein
MFFLALLDCAFSQLLETMKELWCCDESVVVLGFHFSHEDINWTGFQAQEMASGQLNHPHAT